MIDAKQKIIDLLNEEKGEKFRLQDMLDRLQVGKELYLSDENYLKKFASKRDEKQIEAEKELTRLKKKRDELLKEVEEKPINLEKLRKSQPKSKPQKSKPIKFAVSYSNSRSGSAKIHSGGCHNVLRSSQEGDIKWNYYTNYPSAKHTAQYMGQQQPYGWKHAGCCMNSYPFDIIFGSIITTLIFGILGGLVAWYFTRDHFGETWAKTWLVLGGIVSSLWTIIVVSNLITN